jgi:transcriptional regulator with XRE-family HTH domain
MEIKFAETLSRLRRESGLSQRQLAKDLGVSQALLSHYENGAREPGLAFVCRVCDYFGVSANALLGRAAGSLEDGALPRSLSDFYGSLEYSPKAVKDSAAAFLEAAARRVSAHINNRSSPLEAAESANDMAAAELLLLRELAKTDK